MSDETREALGRAAAHAHAFLEGLADRPVGATASHEELRAALDGPLPERGVDPARVLDELARAADPGLVASAGPRYYGFVVGGALPAALAADWLASAWDQNAGLYVLGPAAAVVEDVAAAWLKDLLRLPPTASCGFVTGAQMANVAGLAAGRSAVLRDAGWDVEAKGLQGSPPVRVLVGAEAHTTIGAALRLLGLGAATAEAVPVDDAWAMRADALAEALAGTSGPVIVCAQAGNVHTGAFDPLPAIGETVRAHGGWLHVDGAFGLWAAASPSRRHMVDGVELAHSWATDAHKWLNVPYDSGLVFAAEPEIHHRALALSAAYLTHGEGAERDPESWTPESSRRARGFAVYAALRSLGRQGVADLVDRCCDLAVRFADGLRGQPGVEVVNDVVLNQVLVRFPSQNAGDDDARTRAVVARIQRDGVIWAGGSMWHGQAVLRLSVSGWPTTAADIDRSVAAVLSAAAATA
jgi:glutamate/tyrosine decarboxylase-like PLP-dependent enzyme